MKSPNKLFDEVCVKLDEVRALLRAAGVTESQINVTELMNVPALARSVEVTVTWVESAVQEIADCVEGDATKHAMEDDLYCTVLEAIAEDRCDEPAALAHQALQSRAIAFRRFCE